MEGSWAVALISLAGVLAGALITAASAAHRDRVARREKTQQEALYAVQDACLAHRQAYASLAEAQEQSPAAFRAASREVDRTRQVLDLTSARVLRESVVGRVVAWRAIVAPALLRDDVRDVSASEEDQAWKALQAAVRSELLWLSSRRRR